MDDRIVAWERRFRIVCLALAVVTITLSGLAVAQVFHDRGARAAAIPAPTFSVPPKRVGEAAPAFTLPAVDGRMVSLSALYARGAVVGLICTCGGHDGLAIAARLSESAGGPAVVGVMRGTRQSVAAFAAENRITTPLLVDEDGIVEREFGYNTHPTYVFVDRAGRIAALRIGDFGYAKGERREFETAIRKDLAAIEPTRRGR